MVPESSIESENALSILQTTTFALQDVCIHPEYNEPLLKELKEGYEEFERTGRGLPLLDSFIKESARLTPVEARKKAHQFRMLEVYLLTSNNHQRAHVAPP